MNKKTRILVILIFIIAFQSCKTTQESASLREINSENKEIGNNTSLFLDAKKQKILGNYNQAIQLYNKCLEKYPDDAASSYELSKLYLKLKDEVTALEHAKKAYKIDPGNKWYALMLGRLYLRNKDFKKSAKIYQEIIENEPENLEYYFELASAYLLQKDTKKAIKAYNEIEKKIGVTERTSFQKRGIYLRDGKINEAAKEIKKLIEAFPKEIKYYSILAEFYLSNDMEEKGVEVYKKIAELDPQNEYIHISLSDYYRKAGDDKNAFLELKLGFQNPSLDINTKIQLLTNYYAISGFFVKNEKQIVELSEILIAIHPENYKPYAILGDLYYHKNDFINARKKYLNVIQLNKSNYFVREQLLFCESKLRNYEEMVVESSDAIKLFPQQPILYLFSGVGNFQLRNFNTALQSFKTGARFIVDNKALEIQFYSYIGDAYHELKNNVKSDEAYEKVLSLDPENSLVLNNYAYYLSLRNKKLDKAEKMSKKSVELDKENSSNLDTYAWILYKLNKFDEAKKWIEKAIEAGGGNNAVILEHFGDILYKMNKKNQALKQWEKATLKGKGSDLLNKKIQHKKLYE